ncbi:MAG: ThuA domain-containing protein [Pirellulales bacterium]
MRVGRFVQWLFVFLAIATAAGADEPKKLLLIGQTRDNHPPRTHEYMMGLERLAGLLEPVANLQVTLLKADEPWPEGPQQLADADGVVLFLTQGAAWCQADPRRFDAISRLAQRGGGIVGLHWAIGAKPAEPIPAFLQLLGGCHGGPDRKYQVVETDVHIAEGAHPITAGLHDFRVHDEFYYQLKFVSPSDTIRPILQVTLDGSPQTVAWTYERPDGGRSFGFSGLHFHDNLQREEYCTFLKRAVLWSVKLPTE